MSRRAKIGLGVLVVLGILLTLNTIGVDNETEEAEATIEEAQIMALGGGAIQVLDTPSEVGRKERGIPVVLIHCYTCSLRWWDLVAPILAERHRVVRLDLLGHGGSAKPAEGYDVDAQADLVAEALGELGVEGALVTGHSLGASIATSLAQRHSELVDRVALIGVGPDNSFSDLGLTAELSRAPVIGQALWRITPRFMWESGTEIAFASGFETANGFEDEDQPADDLRAMTYTAYDRWPAADDEWDASLALNRRLASANISALVILGAEDQIVDTDDAATVFRETVPAARVTVMETVGHSPNVEAPEETAALLEQFAAEAEPR